MDLTFRVLLKFKVINKIPWNLNFEFLIPSTVIIVILLMAMKMVDRL